jgi:NTP pyrophosphatase (non-canonical NTP hydrolase)
MKQMIETQMTISMWAEKTFGPVSSNARVAARANEEMAELLRRLTTDDWHPETGEEIADVVIVLYRLAHRMGYDLHNEVNLKMAINRTSRVWRRDGSGHGYHLKEAQP